jgi:hypothetical protein
MLANTNFPFGVCNCMSFLNARKYFSQQEIMFDCLAQAPENGLNLEFGVFEGRTINLCSKKYPDREFYGFDSFEGLPEDWRDGFSKGFFSLRGRLPAVNPNVSLIKGLFSDTLENFLEERGGDPVSFIHVDCDLYSSTKYILETLKHRIAVGGTIILFDEFYNYPGWENGEYKAWCEFAENNNIGYDYIGYNVNHEQVALKIYGAS